MAVQIPRVQRTSQVVPDQTPSRIEATAPNIARGVAAATDSLYNLGQKVVDYRDEIEKNYADTEATRRATEYDKWYNTRLEGDSENGVLGLKRFEGDPTKAYNDFDKEAEEKLKTLMDTEGLSERTKRAIENKLMNKYNSLYDKRLTAYGQQYNVYEDKVTNDAVELEIKSALEDVAFLDVTNPDATLSPFEDTLSRIKELRINHGLKKGSAFIDPKGEYARVGEDGQIERVKLSNSVKVAMAKDVSDATYGAINNLIAADQIGKADIMMKRYKDQLDPVNSAKLTKSFEEARIKEGGYQLLDKTAGKTAAEQKSIIRKSNADIKVKQEALKLLDANERYQTNLQTRDSKEAYDALGNAILTKMKSGTPFDSVAQLEENPTFKRLLPRITDTKQRQALYEMIEQPNTSDEQAMGALLEKLRTGQLYGMNAYDLEMESVGLSKQDKNWIRGQWAKQNTDTESQERSRANYASGLVYKAANAAGLVRKDSRGKQTKKSLKEVNDMTKEILQDIEQFPKGATPNDINTYIQERVSARVLEKKRENRGFFSKIGGIFGFGQEEEEPIIKPQIPSRRGEARSRSQQQSDDILPDKTTTKAPPNTKPTGFKDLSTSQRTQLVKDYKKAHNGKAPSGAADLMEWYNSKGK